jgi:multimeric flavodoxin WrbA
MKALIILGSPRKQGNTDLLLNKIQQGLNEAGCTFEQICLNNLKIRPCQACGGCDKTGVCVIQDDMQDLYPKIDIADVIIIGSPIYFYNVTAQTKAFIDRTQAMWSRKYNLKQKTPPGKQHRCGYLVCVSATQGEKIFEGASITVKYALDAMDIPYCGNLFVRGVDSKGAIKKKETELKRAYEFGKQIAARHFCKEEQEPA